MEINWYPGHMAKSKRLLADQLKRVDVVLELCDARLPESSRNPELECMIATKKRVLLLNKADLADQSVTAAWIRVFRRQGIAAAPFCATTGKSKEALSLIEKAAREAVEKAAQKGMKKTVRAMVVGVPNVGKSTFINMLHGSSIARTGDRPGVTRANQWVNINPYLQLMDSPGLMWPKLDDQVAARRLCYIGSIKDDVVDLPMLTICLLEDLLAAKPEAAADRFRISDPALRGEALLADVCRGRGFLLKGGVFDYDRCCSVVLDEFRAGKCGRITLESPKEQTEVSPEQERKDQDGTD